MERTKHKNCPQCGTRAKAEAKRCPECGTALAEPESNIVDKASADSFPASDAPSY